MLTGLFITGTDTGVGKTRVGIGLARGLVRHGWRVRARKPVESGCRAVAGTLLPADAEALRQAAGGLEPLARVCPYPLAAALAPPRAAALEKRSLPLAALVDACRAGVAAGDFVLVEGAGGFLSPLATDGLNADLALALALPVLLVAEDRLGAIHQVLATSEAIARRGLRLAGVVLNAAAAPPDPGLDNAADLSARLDAPLFALPHAPAAMPLDPLPDAWIARLLARDP
jgi:dethiobiotin synthetase